MDSLEPMGVAVLTMLYREHLKDPLVPSGMRYRFI